MTDAQVAEVIPPQLRAKFNANNAAHRAKMGEDNEKVAKAVQPLQGNLAGYRRLGRDIEVMELTARSLGVPVDELRNTRYKQFFGASNIKKVSEWLASGGTPTEKHEKQAREISEAVRRFDQLYAGDVTAYMRSESGGNITPSEGDRLAQFIAMNSAFDSVKNFQKDASMRTQSQMKAAVNSARDPLVRESWLAYLGLTGPSVAHQGIEGYNSFDKAQSAGQGSGNTGRSRPNTVDPHVGTQEDSEVQRAIKNLKGMGHRKAE
jgi:hypothetical protein